MHLYVGEVRAGWGAIAIREIIKEPPKKTKCILNDLDFYSFTHNRCGTRLYHILQWSFVDDKLECVHGLGGDRAFPV